MTRFGCQTYSWQMSGETYRGRVPNILDVVARAGMNGLEAETCMLGDYYDDPEAMARELSARGVELTGVCLVADWLSPRETAQERADADRLMAYLSHFPGAMVYLGQMPGSDRGNLAERQRNALACMHEVARRAVDAGLDCAFHPNSPAGSIFRTREDYATLIDGLDEKLVGFAPDAGHIAKGGMDPVEIFSTYRPLIRHVHFKDIDEDGTWVEMGRGVIDFPAIVSHLAGTGYDGWIMIEDESARAERDPDAVTLENGEYIREALLPAAGNASQQRG
jgi:inosose dehydratase